ncbi:hypothetical protein AK812_SmicGene40083 [Symbiodinium microadriaticum]|uniref:Uncharacterized protein n=1 Tax=Symbiodinium microadriaticum TaxID=2951 RepID=A0A1Q9C9M3_SYMMI|nr:hypothetical protein AK812_SmicGene40083 [Symbiodinium microadriaticum]
MFCDGTGKQKLEPKEADDEQADAKPAKEKRYRRKTPRQLAQEAIFDAMWASGLNSHRVVPADEILYAWGRQYNFVFVSGSACCRRSLRPTETRHSPELREARRRQVELEREEVDEQGNRHPADEEEAVTEVVETLRFNSAGTRRLGWDATFCAIAIQVDASKLAAYAMKEKDAKAGKVQCGTPGLALCKEVLEVMSPDRDRNAPGARAEAADDDFALHERDTVDKIAKLTEFARIGGTVEAASEACASLIWRFNAFSQQNKEDPHPPPHEAGQGENAEPHQQSEQPPKIEVETMTNVKYQGQVESTLWSTMSLVCQSDHMFTWVHALATILIINEKAFSGGLKVSEQLRMWQDRLRILAKPPWILAPLHLAVTEKGTTWAEAMTARPVMGTDGTLTIALGEGENYRVHMGPEMQETLESDDNFEIVASTITAIYDQPCRSCGLVNRMIIYMPKDGKVVRKIRIDHKLGDTPVKQQWLRPDKRQSQDPGPVSDKRQKDDESRPSRHWEDRPWWQSSDWEASSSSSWRWNN